MYTQEQMSPLSALPEVWQEIARGSHNNGLSMVDDYVTMARLFHYKYTNGDIDLVNKRGFNSEDVAVLGTLAEETLEFFGNNFGKENYPDFQSLEQEFPTGDQAQIVKTAKALFEEFGYDFPACFYHVHLAPLARAEVCEIRPLRFSEEDKQNARAWDACLHGQKVFPIQLKIQSITSQNGFFWEHGCGCNHGLSRLGRTSSAFDYEIRPEMRATWLRDYIWTVWYEYALFDITPVTSFLTGNILEFEYS